MVCDRNGWPLAFTLSPGQHSDTQRFISTLECIRLPGFSRRLRKRCRFLVGDKGYDSDFLRRYCDRRGIKPIIASRNMQRKSRPGLPRGFDKPKYRERNIIERCIGWVKELRHMIRPADSGHRVKLVQSLNEVNRYDQATTQPLLRRIQG